MIILFLFLTLSYQSKIYHNCTSNLFNLETISEYLVDYEISCPNQNQQIDLRNSKNTKTISISEKTKSVTFICDQRKYQESIIIYGEPDIYFQNSCNFQKFEIYGFPFFHKSVGTAFNVNQVLVYNNPNFPFPFNHDSINYINDTNYKYLKSRNKIIPKDSNTICIGDDQEFADNNCDGNLLSTTEYKFEPSSPQIFIKFSQPTNIKINFYSPFKFTSLYINADINSSKIGVTLVSSSPIEFSDTIRFENVDVIFELSNQGTSVISSEYLKLYSSTFKSSGDVLSISSNKIILEDSSISQFSFNVSKEYFYYMSNVHQIIPINQLSESLKRLIFVNATVEYESKTILNDVDLVVKNSKISSNLVFDYTIPNCNMSLDDNSELCIRNIYDGYSLVLKSSKLLPVTDGLSTMNIQHLQIFNADNEIDLSNIEFGFKITNARFDTSITIYAEKKVNLNVLAIGESKVPANFKIINCTLNTDPSLIAYSLQTFELDGSEIPSLKQIWSHRKITTIRFDNIDKTPEINLRYDPILPNGEIHLSNVWITLQTSSTLNYISLENNAKIYGENAKTNEMSLSYLNFLEYEKLVSSNQYIIDIKGKIVMTFRDDNVIIAAESNMIEIDSSKENSLFHNLTYTTDYGDVNFINESTKSYDFHKIFYSMNKGKFGNIEFDRFTKVVDNINSTDFNWKFKGITIHTGIVPFSKITLTEPVTHFYSDNKKTTYKFKEIIMQSKEISINACIYTDSLYTSGFIVHFISTDSVFEANDVFVDPVSANFDVNEITDNESTKKISYEEDKCIKSAKNNIMIIDRLNVYGAFRKNRLKFNGLIQVKSVYYDSDNSRIKLLPSIYGKDCFDTKKIYLNHSLINDSVNYFFGGECILSFDDENDIITNADFIFNPPQVDGKDIRIMCMASDPGLAESNFAETILYLPNEEVNAKIITITVKQFVIIACAIIAVVVLMIVIIFGIVCYRYSHGTLKKND